VTWRYSSKDAGKEGLHPARGDRCHAGNDAPPKLILLRRPGPSSLDTSPRPQAACKEGIRLIDGLKRCLQGVAAAMLLAIVLIVLANVILRYFFHVGLGWTEEAARFLLIGMTFVAAAVAVQEWGHFRLLIGIRWIPVRFHGVVQLFAILVTLVMSVLLVRYGIALVTVSWLQTSPTMEWRMGYIYLIVPATGAIMAVFALGHLWHALLGRPPSVPSHGGDLPVDRHGSEGAA
jgi:TRAP-type C4-dicarboxylate transport system permease small subunit